MTASTIVCGSCSGEVPYGRLSCPSCGELLASVVGGRVASAASIPAARAEPRPTAPAPARPEPTAPVPAVPPILYDPADAPTAAVLDGAIATGDTAPLWPDDAEPDDAVPDDAVPDDEPVAAPVAPPTVAAATTSYDGPGAYLPPAARSFGHQPAPPPLPQPAGPAAPARAWGASAVTAVASDTPTAPDVTPTTVAAEAARVAEFVGWLAVAGGALASVGFLLPWSNVAVIGARGVGYFDRWGLAGPSHVVVVVGLLVVVALSIVSNPVPAWVRVGLAGGGLAALLIGLAWPYLLGPLGAGPGVLCVGLGAVLLGVASVVAIVTDRRTGSARGV